jgi:hypothetical protein
MIKYNNLKKGDIVMSNYEGTMVRGEITDLKKSSNQACILSGESEFWFSSNDLYTVEITDEELAALGFVKEPQDDGSVKYLRGAFRMVTPVAGNFNEFDIWYREDKRHIVGPVFLHQLQNHHLDMTKSHLSAH